MSIIVNEDFFTRYSVCQTTIDVIKNNDLLGKDVPEVLRCLRDLGIAEPTVWWNHQKSTENYVKDNGEIITMGAYQVFNPLTGVHTKYETEVEAKAALVEVARAILEAHCPTIVQEISNENGDATWVPTEIHKTLVIS